MSRDVEVSDPVLCEWKCTPHTVAPGRQMARYEGLAGLGDLDDSTFDFVVDCLLAIEDALDRVLA